MLFLFIYLFIYLFVCLLLLVGIVSSDASPKNVFRNAVQWIQRNADCEIPVVVANVEPTVVVAVVVVECDSVVDMSAAACCCCCYYWKPLNHSCHNRSMCPSYCPVNTLKKQRNKSEETEE